MMNMMSALLNTVMIPMAMVPAISNRSWDDDDNDMPDLWLDVPFDDDDYDRYCSSDDELQEGIKIDGYDDHQLYWQ
jgi:hypothetical protein